MASCEVCRRTGGGIKRCTRCLSVWYCSPECQKQDWPMHKSSCGKTSRAKQAESGDKAVPLAREDEKGSAGRQVTSVGDPSASSVPSASGDPSPTNGLSASGESSTDSHCYKCGKREAELKKCGKCKKVTYCSRDCQRQDWATHKTACATLSARVDDQGTAAENGDRRELFRQVMEETARRISTAFTRHPVHPLTLLMWMQARPRAARHFPGDEVVESFHALESDMPFITPSPRRVVLLCLMKEVSYHPFRYGRILEDIDGFRLRVLFYNEQRPEPYFRYEQLREGNFLCLANALVHAFRDGTVGIRVNDPSLVHIIDFFGEANRL